MLRDSVVAGQFYASSPIELKNSVAEYLVNNKDKVKAKAIIVPHAGYMYSGRIAGEVYSSVEMPENIVILGPNHTGMGESIAVVTDGAWRTPLGDVKINGPLANDIMKNSTSAKSDDFAHKQEHSIEVQLPFLQKLSRNFAFVPICIGEPDKGKLKDLACSIFESTKDRDVLIIASTDLSHYEEAKIAQEKDSMVLSAIQALDEEQLYKNVKEYDISMCGWMGTYVAIYAAKLMGATAGKITRYGNSGEVSGDYSQVVGYCGAVIT